MNALAGKLRVGVAGLGFGAAVHIPALLAQPDVELVGIAGRSAERAGRVARDLGVEHGCASVRELLDLGLDAITLALPPDQAAPAVTEALQAGTAVLCEKPLAADAVEAASLAILAAGRVTAMDFIFAELGTFQRLKALIDGAELGRVRHAHVLWLTESWANRNRRWSWKTNADRHGGVISLFGTHLFFLAEWLFGPACTVQAHACPPVAADFAPAGRRAAEDLVHCRMQHPQAMFAATFGNANPGIAIQRWTVVFERGTAVLENSGADYVSGFALQVADGTGVQRFVEPEVPGDGRLAAFTPLVRRFLDGVRSGTRVYPDVAAGARVQLLDDAARRSIANAQEIKLC